ncbi:MAG: MoaD/ThiS family protein [Elusimicrobiaceae bacterium]
MATITLQFQGVIKQKAGVESLSIDGGTIKAAILNAEKQLGPAFSAELYHDGKIKSYYMFILNGEIVDAASIGRKKLADGDILRLFAPVGGG